MLRPLPPDPAMPARWSAPAFAFASALALVGIALLSTPARAAESDRPPAPAAAVATTASRDAVLAGPHVPVRDGDAGEAEQGARPDDPGGLMRERWRMMTSGDTTATAQLLVDARAQLAQADAQLRRARPAGVLDAGLSTWEWLGPGNLGGRTLAILFDPADASHLWAGTASGGLWTSHDGGVTWSPIDDFLPSLSITSLARDASTGYLYAGTGEFVMQSTPTGGAVDGAGVFRSTDGGNTWAQLPATVAWHVVGRIATVAADGFVYAATDSGLFRSSNSGLTWSRMLVKNPLMLDVKATATTHLLLVGTLAGGFRSTDSGLTWTALSTGFAGGLPAPAGRVEFAIASDQQTCYASVEVNGGELWRSIDAGATWQRRRTGDNWFGSDPKSEQGWYDNAVWVDPTNANVVVVGGVDAWRSTDGGTNFDHISDWKSYPGSSAHADHHVIVQTPNYDGTTIKSVYFGNDGGVQRKDDILAGSGGWTNFSSGLITTQFYRGAIQAGSSDLMGGMQDNGTYRRVGTNTWTKWYGGDGGYCSFDAGSGKPYWEYVNLDIHRDDILGLQPSCTSGLTDARDECNSLFISPFKSDPFVPGRMFAGGSSVWRSLNEAGSWASVRGPIHVVTNPPGSQCPTAKPLVSAIELVSSDSNLVWIGYTDGTVSRSTDNGATWTDVNGGAPGLPGRWVTDIAVNPGNRSEVYVTFGGFMADNVWFTSDGGTTWSIRSGSGATALPAVPVETITIHPSNRAWIYAGTSLGVLASQDRGLHWSLMRRDTQSEGPAYTQVSDLLWQGNQLIAFTFGRSVFRSSPISGTTSTPPFALLDTGLPAAAAGSCDWGDFDNDGDLDVVWTGNTQPSDTLPPNPFTYIARNDGGGTFTRLDAGLPGVTDGAARWGDYDNDGRLDLVVTGMTPGGTPIARIYHNDGGGHFSDIHANLTAVSRSDAAWADIDNDGDLDLVVSGLTAPNNTNTGSTFLYRNDGSGVFTNINAGFTNVQHSSVAWGDYDNDGDLDLLVCGWLGSSATPVTLLYRNDGNGVFANVTSGLPNVEYSVQWGDYNADGRLDMLLSGSSGVYVMRNNGGGTFTTAATLPAHLDGRAAWGDFDSDGDLDIAATGHVGNSDVTSLYRYDIGAGTYVDTGAPIGGAHRASLAWADFDDDGDVDLFLTGWSNTTPATQVYRNDNAGTNTPPWKPVNLSVTTSGCGPAGTQVTFNWGASQYDDHTPVNVMGYNLRVGTTPGGIDVLAPAADLATGARRLPGLGNAQLRRSWTLTLPAGVYYWGVQSVDGSGKGSVFTGETTTIVSTNFSDIAAGLLQTHGSASWGDFDGDDDLDLLVSGAAGTNVYRNNGGTFTPIAAGLPALDYAVSAWADFDGDGDLDFALCGCSGGTYTTRVYRNDAGTFTNVGAALPGVCGGALAWADYDGDGRPDLAITGATATGVIAKVYHNDGGGYFSDSGASLAGVSSGGIAWGDYDGDGDPDLLVTGIDALNVRHTDLYRNDGGGLFTLVTSGLPPVWLGAAAWADIDNDGDLDLVLAGSTGVGTDQITNVYRNDGGGTFTDIHALLTGVQECSLNWGDLSNDGRLDLLVTGYNPVNGYTSNLYLANGAGGFVPAAGTGLTGVSQGTCDLGDYDKDGRLDAVLIGHNTAEVTKILRGCGAGPNAAPAAPTGLQAVRKGTRMVFSWNASSDDHSPAGTGLTYNLRIGTTPGGNDVLSSVSNGATGFHRVARPGNALGRLNWSMVLSDQRYYWSVQAVDPAYRAGPFAVEETLGVALVPIASSIPTLYRSTVAWGDYDNDGDLDLLMAGTDGIASRTYLLRNDSGTFVNTGAALAPVEWCSLDWGDYDRDGDLDIALCGWSNGTLVSKIYRNDGGGTFTDINAALPGVIAGTVAWGDYDGDGDLDLFLCGDLGNGTRVATVYQNNNGVFVPRMGLEPVSYSYADWGDYDNDGDLDLVVCGYNGTIGVTHVYRNDLGHLVDSGLSLPGVWEGSVQWGDYDADGKLDLLLTGWTGTQRITGVWRNADNLLTRIPPALEGLSSSRAAWGDYDNDGDLDIVATGYYGAGGHTTVYRNDNGIFVPALIPLPGMYYSSVAWGDYDGDGDLDLVATGLGGTAHIYRNDGAPRNQPPSTPTGLAASLAGSTLTLSWARSNDDHTGATGLTYNVRAGTTPGGIDILSPMSFTASGKRKLARRGDADLRLSLPLQRAPAAVYWSVQAEDGAFIASPFAPEVNATLGTPVAPPPIADAIGPATPNPCDRGCVVSLALAHDGPVSVEVFDLAGQRVATLVRGTLPAGVRTVRWEARGENGAPLAAGMYFARLRTPATEQSLKLVVLK